MKQNKKRNFVLLGIVFAATVIGLFFLQSNRSVSDAKADTFSLSCDTKQVKKNQTFTLAVKVSSKETMQQVGAQIKYDSNLVSYESSDDTITGADGILTLNDTFAKPTLKKTYKITFRALELGTCNFVCEEANYNLYNDLSVETKGSVKTNIKIIKNKKVNRDSSLKELLVGQGDLLEDWSEDCTDYTVLVPEGTTLLTYSATPSNKDAVVTSKGPEKLTTKDNKYYITVTAPSGESTEYTLTAIFDHSLTNTTDATEETPTDDASTKE